MADDVLKIKNPSIYLKNFIQNPNLNLVSLLIICIFQANLRDLNFFTKFLHFFQFNCCIFIIKVLYYGIAEMNKTTNT